MKVTAAQIKELKGTIRSASDDLQNIFEPLTGEMSSAPNFAAKGDMRLAVQSAAQRGFWLAVSDKAYSAFGIDMPEYAKASGRLRNLVDREAVLFSRRLAA